MKNILLAVLLLGLLFSFTTPAYSYTWVELGDYYSVDESYVNGKVWYDPSTIKKDGIGSVLIKIYYPKTKENIMVWMAIDCEAKKGTLANPVLVDQNDNSLSSEEGETEVDITLGSGSVVEHVCQMLCSKNAKTTH